MALLSHGVYDKCRMMSSATPPTGVRPLKRKRVAIVYPFFAHYRGAVLRELLANSIFDFVLVGDTVGQSGIETWPIPAGTEFRNAPLLRWGSWEFQRGLISLACERDLYAIIYLGNARSFSTWISTALARLLGKRVYFWTHGWTRLDEGGIKGWFRRMFYRLPNGLLLYGHMAKALAVGQKFDPKNLHVIYNSLDYDQQHALRESVSADSLRDIRLSLFNDADTSVAVSSTRLVQMRRLDLLIEALAILNRQGHPVNLLLIGDGPERQNLQQLAEKLGVRIAFTGACYEESRLAVLIMASSVTVSPGKVGLTVVQSLAYGVPVITHGDWNDQGPEWEAIVPGKTGDYFRKEDAQDLAKQIRKWTSLPSVSRETRRECISTIEQFYTPRFQRQAIDRALSGYPADDLLWQREPSRDQNRPVVTYISNGFTPYGVHFLNRVSSELLEIDLRCIYTHEYSMGQWNLSQQARFPLQQFGRGEWTTDSNKPARLWHEWQKGGRILAELDRLDTACVVLLGYNNLGCLRIISWCSHNRIPCYIWGDSNIRCDRTKGLKALIKSLLLQHVLKRTSGALACGSLGKAYFAKYGVGTDRIFLVPNEPNYATIIELPERLRAEAALRFGIDRARRRIIFSGRLIQLKRIDLLIQAFVDIATKRPDWDLMILGQGPLRNELGSLVPENLRSRVIWPGFLGDQKDVAALYQLSHVLALPSDYEAWALVVNEAAAAGLAIVASDVVGAAAELVKDGENGRIFPRGDAGALKAALLDVTSLGTTERMQEASRAVLQRWREKADPVRGLREALVASHVLPPASLAIPDSTDHQPQ